MASLAIGQEPASASLVGIFESREAAERAVAELLAEGRNARIQPAVESVRFHRVEIVEPTLARALRLSQELRQRGVRNWVARGAEGEAHAVVVGFFAVEANAARQLDRMQGLGYRDARVIAVERRRTHFRVDLLDPGQPAPVSPPVAEPEPEREYLPPVAELGATLDGRAVLEAGLFNSSPNGKDASHYVHGSLAAAWRFGPRWELRAGVRADGYREAGADDLTETRGDLTETYLRFRSANARVTLGAQQVIWGRVDEIPPADQLAPVDAARVVLDELADRRRVTGALRIEAFRGETKLDLLWVPRFREAELPEPDSVWHPVDPVRGRILGIEPSPVLAALVSLGSFAEDDEGDGGGGLRVTHAGETADYGFTLLRARRSLPYYELDEGVRLAVLTGTPVPAAIAAASGSTFTARHPKSWLLGADASIDSGAIAWRLEAAVQSDVPVTGLDLRLQFREALQWVAGMDLYPGDGDARVTLQLAGFHLKDAGRILDPHDRVSLIGEIDWPFARRRWRARGRFGVGLNLKDNYFNPEISFIGREPHEFYLGAHLFAGDPDTLGGYYQDNDLWVAGWRARY